MDSKPDKIETRDGKIICPVCGRKIHEVVIEDDTEAKRLRVFCHSCRKPTVLNISSGRCVERWCP